MSRLLQSKQLRKEWSAVAFAGEDIRYAFVANAPGSAHVQLSRNSRQMMVTSFGVVGALASGRSIGNTASRSASEHLPIHQTVVIALGSHRRRAWRASAKGKPEVLVAEISYPAIANIQVRQLNLRAAMARVKAGEVTITFGDRSTTCFETDVEIAEQLEAMLSPIIGGAHAVREESYSQRQAVAQLKNRVAAMRARSASS